MSRQQPPMADNIPMPVTIDEEPLNAEELGLTTVGDVIGRINRSQRLVVRLLIDGEAPDLTKLQLVNAKLIKDRCIYIETAEIAATALDALAQAEKRLSEGDKHRTDTAARLRRGEWTAAMETLSQFLGCWLEAQRTAVAVAKLCKIELEKLKVSQRSIGDISGQMADQLRRIQSAVQAVDLVELIDLVAYETADVGATWQAALKTIALRVRPLQHVQSPA
jgi:hypothetical protein